MVWIVLSALVFVTGVVLICKKISSKAKKVSSVVVERGNSLGAMLDQRKTVLSSLKEASKGYTQPEDIEGLQKKIESLMSEEAPIEYKLKAIELELNALKKINERAVSKEVVEVEPRDVKDFHIMFEKFFRSLTPQACSELKAHANLLESLDVEIIKLSEKLAELSSNNKKIESSISQNG